MDWNDPLFSMYIYVVWNVLFSDSKLRSNFEYTNEVQCARSTPQSAEIDAKAVTKSNKKT